MAVKSLFSELRKRRVIQAAVIYSAVAWGVVEVLVTVVDHLFLPQWVSTLAVIGFVVGFPAAMFLAWTFDITTDGMQRTHFSSRRGKFSILFSIMLVIVGTAGLFFLIKPAMVEREFIETNTRSPAVLPNSLAVLPFDHVSPDSGDRYLSDGLGDQLRDQLGRVNGLRLAARSSSIAVQEQATDARTKAEKLGVAMLVEGSVRHEGKLLRISVELIDGSSGLSIWSETFQRGPNELLGAQQLIAEQLIRHVLPESEFFAVEPATGNNTANELMLLARHYEQQVRDRQEVDVDTLHEAIRLYRQATEADPGSALAHSRLAGTLLYLGDLEAAEAPIFKALSLDPNLSEVQNTLGEYYWARGMPEARAAFARAVELNGNNADALTNYANQMWLSRDMGDLAINDLANFLSHALDLDRLSLARHAALGGFLGNNGKVEETRVVIQGVKALFKDVESCRLISWLLELTGDVDESIAWAIRARDLEPENPDHTGRLAELYVVIGDLDTALKLDLQPSIGLLFLMRQYPELIDIAEILMIEEPEDINIRYLLSFAYQATGQFESAIHVLSSTGQPDTLLNDKVRSVSDIEAYYSVINALAGVGEIELAQGLAIRELEGPKWGDPGWLSVHKGCALAVLGGETEALERLEGVLDSPRLVRNALIRDYFCFQQYSELPKYQFIIQGLDQRRSALREKLPQTLAEFGLEL